MKLLLKLLCGIAILCGAPLHAETLEEVAARFGARPSVLDVSLAPSGSKLSYIAPAGYSAETVFVVNLAAGDGHPVPILTHADPDLEIAWCLWASDDRLICQAQFTANDAGQLLSFSRLFALNADGTNVVMLTSRDKSSALGLQQFGGAILSLELPDKPGHILMSRQWVPEMTTGSRLKNSEEGLGVEDVDISNGRRSKVELPEIANAGFTADEAGRVRLKVRQVIDPAGYLKGDRQYYFRDAQSDRWRQITKLTQGKDFLPVAVDSQANLAYGFVDNNGFDAVAALSLDGSDTLKTILSRDDVDIDEVIRIGRQRRVVGVSYATEKRQIDYLDNDLKKLSAQFEQALVGKPLINIVDSNEDESKLLIVASSDTDPGMVYLFDKTTRQLDELLPLRNELAGTAMAPMVPISYLASDGTSIPGYLTLPIGSGGKNLPTIVLPHGGPSSRDEWGFDWLVQFFVARGYAVLQPNYRGSAGYGADWFGRNGFQSWKLAIGDVNDAGRWLVQQGIADPAKLAIVGWSYGGYAALQSQVLDNRLYKAVVAIAPVTDLEMLREQSRDFKNFRQVDSFIGNGPHISEGSPARNAKYFAAPVLLFHGTLDQNVAVGQSRLMKDRLQEAGKSVEYVEFEGRDHFIDDTWARSNMLVGIDKFLAAALN